MTTSENVALGRRVEQLEATIIDQALILVRTTLVVCERVEEPEYTTIAEVLEAAEREPEVREVRRIPDLELLIDPVKRTRKLRSRLSKKNQEKFDELKNAPGVRVIDVEIRCHEAQVRPILSSAPTVAAFGGNRAGKSMILIWWLFRRWMLRGGPPRNGKPRVFWWVGPDMVKVIEEGVWAIAGELGLGGGVWPSEVFVNLKPCPRTKKNPELELVDGSRVLFKHANFSGESAGKNLKSANVVDAVVDELGAIRAHANFHQVQVRVSQTGGHVATSTTRVLGHWSHDEITMRAEETGAEVIDVSNFDLFQNPWMSYARIWQLFINDRTLTRRQLESQVLPAKDKRAACLALVTNPKSLREHFGEETAASRFMWSSWSDDFIYSSAAKAHAEIYVRDEDGHAKRLLNITAQVLAKRWPRQTAEGQRFSRWGAMDFNVRGHAVVLELFGEGETVEQAVANEASWTVMVVDEVQVDGTTIQLVRKLKSQAGVMPVWYDPHGAKGHAARGTSATSTDADILRQEGFPCAPTNGVDLKTGAPLRLSQIESRNVMHGLMDGRRFLVHERCVGLIDAMHKDLRKPDGTGDKRSSPDSETDFRSGYSDSARYGIWPICRNLFVVDKKKRAA